MLAAQGSSPRATATRCSRASTPVERELGAGTFPFAPDDEDIHMAVERRLTEIAGPVGGKLHTARSRNDQVATDVALFTRAHALEALDGLRADGGADRRRRAPRRLADARLHAPAARPAGLPRPPPARLRLDARPRRAALPLRPVAGRGCRWARARWPASTSTPTAAWSPPSSASPAVAPNSIDAVSNRDFVLDYLDAAATCATHLSRLGAELVLWSSAEFGFCEVADALGQRLVDHAAEEEPRRGRAAARQGAARRRAPDVALHGVMHGLPLTYNKDLQEDKEHLFDAVDTLELCLDAARGMIAGARFQRERMEAAASDDLIAATDVADLLVRRGVPFRESHGDRRRAGARDGRLGGALARRPLAEELARHSRELDDEFYTVLAQQSSWLESKVSEGGTALAAGARAARHARASLDDQPG